MARSKYASPRAMTAAPASQSTFADPIEQLEALDLPELRVRYRQLLRKTAPAHLPRWLLLRIVAYRMQAQVLGDLDAETVRLLGQLARLHESDLKARAKAEASGKPWSKPAVPRVPAVTTKGRVALGTEFVREFNGQLHRVVAVESGFAWIGATYGSLSQIAKAITGTSWNGPAFFGLRAKRRDRRDPGDSAAEHASSTVATANLPSMSKRPIPSEAVKPKAPRGQMSMGDTRQGRRS